MRTKNSGINCCLRDQMKRRGITSIGHLFAGSDEEKRNHQNLESSAFQESGRRSCELAAHRELCVAGLGRRKKKLLAESSAFQELGRRRYELAAHRELCVAGLGGRRKKLLVESSAFQELGRRRYELAADRELCVAGLGGRRKKLLVECGARKRKRSCRLRCFSTEAQPRCHALLLALRFP